MSRFALFLCVSALMGFFSFPRMVPAADIRAGSTLEDGLLDETLPSDIPPDDPASDVPGTPDASDEGPALPQAAVHAPLPSLTVLRGVCSVNLQASGLLDHLTPFLVRETGIVIQWRAVDDKRAEALIREGNGDIALIALPDKEKALVREGRAELRQEVMRDGYVLIGPTDDLAGIRDQDVLEALRRMADAGVPFVSRGDGSATHKRERALWKKAKIAVRDERNGYVESGQGALPTLAIAEALGAYTLTDEASFLTYQAAHGASQTVLLRDQTLLGRVWSLLPLTPPTSTLEDGEEDAAARALRSLAVHSVLEWWQKPSTRERVARFTREGHMVFTPLPAQPEAPAAAPAPSQPR